MIKITKNRSKKMQEGLSRLDLEPSASLMTLRTASKYGGKDKFQIFGMAKIIPAHYSRPN